MIEIVPTRYGAAAMRALAGAVSAAQEGDPLAPVTVVVPSNYAGVAARRWLAGQGRGVANLTVVTAYRLAELLAAPRLAAAGRRPVTAPVVAAALRRALATAPGMFAEVAEQPGTVDAIHRVHRELRDIPPPTLSALGRTSTRARDVVAIHREAVSRLVAGGWFDERDLLDAATDIVAGDSVGLAARFGTVIVHLPQELAHGVSQLLRAFAGALRVVVLAGLTGNPAADAATARVLRERLGIRRPPELAPPGLFDEVADVLEIDATDPDDEVREAVRRILVAAHRGVPFERIAVAYPSARPYARLVADHLDAAGIPWNGAATVSLQERIAGRTLLGLLDLGERDLPRHELFGLLASVPAVGPLGGPLPVARWEQCSREAGVVGGIDQWRQRLGLLADVHRTPRRHPDAAVDEPLPPDRRLGDVEALRRFMDLLHDRLAPPAARTWATLRTWASGLIDFLVGGEAIREQWPADEQRATDRVLAALDRLAHLDEIEPHPQLASFRHALAAELDAALTTVGNLGRGVFVAPIGLAVGVNAEVTVIVGAAEGMLPPLVRDDPVLRDADRRSVGLLATSDTRRERAHHQALAVGAAATAQLVICRPRGDLRSSRGLHPSRWLADLVAGGAAHDRHHIGSFRHGMQAAPIAATEQEALLVALDAGGRLGTGDPVVAQDLVLKRAVRLRLARDSAQLTEFDGNLSSLAPLPGLASDRPLSPSRLEQWMRCPYSYFGRYLLRVDAVEAPEDLLDLSPLERGALVHGVLEELVRRAIDDGLVPGPEESWTPEQVAAMHATLARTAAQVEARGLTGLPLFWQRQQRKLRRWLTAFLTHDAELRRSHAATPAEVELVFGVDGRPPVEVPLPGGRVLRLAGRIDRVDAGPHGIVVTDYKTSRRSYLGVSEQHPLGRASDRLQLPIYGLAARTLLERPDDPVHVCYLSISDDPGRAVLTLDEGLLGLLDDVVEVTAGGIEGGLFPAHPEGGTAWLHHVSCRYCDPDGLGTASARARWERKRHDPVLGGYLALAEPEAVAT